MDGNVSFDEDIFDRIEKIKNLGKDASSRYAFQLRFGDKWEAEWNKKTEPKIMKTYKIKTKNGKEIICSGNHIFPTTNGEKCIEGGLKIGDKFYAKK